LLPYDAAEITSLKATVRDVRLDGFIEEVSVDGRYRYS
jgi:hypothetical protein